MKECSVVFEELQETHAQFAVPGYLNRFSKLYEGHYDALCTSLDEQVHSNHSFSTMSNVTAPNSANQCLRDRRRNRNHHLRHVSHTPHTSTLLPAESVCNHGRR